MEMTTLLTKFTVALADTFCDGSTKKLIASWWYSILCISFLLTIMTFWTVSTRNGAEAFASFWAAVVIIGLCVGGTMVMRRFHNSTAVGFFMGTVVASAQFFFLLFLIYLGYAHDRWVYNRSSTEDYLQAFICLVQSLLLGSFAAILAAHRSSIVSDDTSITSDDHTFTPTASKESDGYDPPIVMK